MYTQELPLLAAGIRTFNTPERWRAAIFDMPVELRAHFKLPSVVMLSRNRGDGRWDFLITREPCTATQAHALAATFIDALIICNAGLVSLIIRENDRQTHQ